MNPGIIQSAAVFIIRQVWRQLVKQILHVLDEVLNKVKHTLNICGSASDLLSGLA